MNHDVPAEEAVLGAIALAGVVPAAVLDKGLKPEHFYRTTNATIYQQALGLHDEGKQVDTVTLPAIASYSSLVPSLGAVDQYAGRIVEKAVWRARKRAALSIVDATEDENEDAYARAEQGLRIARQGDRVYDPDRLRELAWDRLNRDVAPGWQYPMGLGRMAPGTVHLWGGWTSHGKSVWIDQIAREARAQGATVWGWLNEMDAEERMCRHIAAETGLDLDRVQENRLTDQEKAKTIHALKSIPFGITEAPGWSAEDISRDVRVRQPDIAIVDILHRIPYRDERDLARISQVLGDTAKLARCVVLATVHLNRSRLVGAARPEPVMSDIKGASSFEQDADVIGMVWREDDPTTGRPQNHGAIYTLKFRMSKMLGRQVALDPEHATFRERQEWEL